MGVEPWTLWEKHNRNTGRLCLKVYHPRYLRTAVNPGRQWAPSSSPPPLPLQQLRRSHLASFPSSVSSFSLQSPQLSPQSLSRRGALERVSLGSSTGTCSPLPWSSKSCLKSSSLTRRTLPCPST